MLGLSGTLSCALFVYLCICVFVFVYLCIRHLAISVLISLDQVLSENIWFVWSKPSYSGDVTKAGQPGQPTNQPTKQRKIELLSKPESRNLDSQLLSKSDFYNVFGDCAGVLKEEKAWMSAHCAARLSRAPHTYTVGIIIVIINCTHYNLFRYLR